MADFLGRWSRRKLDVKEGRPPAEPAPAPASVAPAPAPATPATAGRPGTRTTVPGAGAPAAAAGPAAAGPSGAGAGKQDAPPAPLPTLEDVASLTHQGDFRPFMAHGVSPAVKNAAMKKLFADPHYNVMDRLDTYIDDYSVSDPIPESMLRRMVGSRLLGLFDEPPKEPPDEAGRPVESQEVGDDAYPRRVQAVATSYENPDIVSPEAANPDQDSDPASQPRPPSGARASQEPDADTDLRLQPDDAAPAPGAGRGA